METIQFTIERYDDEGIYYVVEGIDIALVTEGATLEEALKNLREAVEFYYEDEPIPKVPQIKVNIIVTEAYA